MIGLPKSWFNIRITDLKSWNSVWLWQNDCQEMLISPNFSFSESCLAQLVSSMILDTDHLVSIDWHFSVSISWRSSQQSDWMVLETFLCCVIIYHWATPNLQTSGHYYEFTELTMRPNDLKARIISSVSSVAVWSQKDTKYRSRG